VSVYLVQHGLAYRESEDPERRLTPRGVEETERVARHLAERGVEVGEIVHSGRARARQTAEIFARFLKAPVREGDGLGPNDDPSIWAGRLAGVGRGVMLVGHLPHLSRLSSLLLVGNPDVEIIKFRYSGVAKLERDGARWALAWYITPELV
jgi:phosphohistidine phosphatase